MNNRHPQIINDGLLVLLLEGAFLCAVNIVARNTYPCN
jgi:hypothetical protein